MESSSKSEISFWGSSNWPLSAVERDNADEREEHREKREREREKEMFGFVVDDDGGGGV